MRKTKDIIIETGRDKGTKFLITEMSAMAAESWAWRAFLAFGKSGVDLPPDVLSAGMAGLAVIGIGALMQSRYEDIRPLMDDLLACVEIVEKAGPRSITEDDIQDAETLFRLRKEALVLHWDFLGAVFQSKPKAAAAPEAKTAD